MGGVFRNETSIYLLAVDVSGSTATANDKIVGEISNIKLSGLEQGSDFKQLFGGDLEIEKAREPGELSFDISVSNTSASALDRWDKLKFSDGTSASETVGKSFWITHYTNNLLKVTGINNAKVTILDTEMAATDELTKSVTLSFGSITPVGVANLRTSTISGSTIVANANAFLNFT